MRRFMSSVALCLALLVSHSGMANNLILLKLDGILGDSKTPNYGGWIVVDNVHLGHGVQPTTGTVGARSLVLVKRLDRSSTGLSAAAASGARSKIAVLDVLRSGVGGTEGNKNIYRVILHDVVVRNYGIAMDLNIFPVENVELGYSRIEWYQYSLAADGVSLIPTQAKFDFSKNLPYQ